MQTRSNVRRVVVALLVAASTLMVASPSEAAPRQITAAEFADDCNDDGLVTLTADLIVRSGQGRLKRSCGVEMDSGVLLRFQDVGIAGSETLAVIGTPSFNTVEVIDSKIDMAEYLELTAGCCSGEDWETNGTLIIERSKLRAQSVLLWASLEAEGGQVFVRDSTVVATKATPGRPNIVVLASGGGAKRGIVGVWRSTFHSPGSIEFKTGLDGQTIVKNNDFTGVVDFVDAKTGVGGSCWLGGNTRPLLCS